MTKRKTPKTTIKVPSTNPGKELELVSHLSLNGWHITSSLDKSEYAYTPRQYGTMKCKYGITHAKSGGRFHPARLWDSTTVWHIDASTGLQAIKKQFLAMELPEIDTLDPQIIVTKARNHLNHKQGA